MGAHPPPPGAQAHEREGRAQPLYRPRKPCARPGSERPEGAAGALAQGFAPAKIPHERSELRRLWQGMRSTLATLRKIRAPGGRRAPLNRGVVLPPKSTEPARERGRLHGLLLLQYQCPTRRPSFPPEAVPAEGAAGLKEDGAQGSGAE